MSTPLRVRVMDPSEAGVVSELIAASIRAKLPQVYPPEVVEVLAQANHPRGVVNHLAKQTDYVALVDGQIVGMAGLKRNEIGHLYVAPQHVGRGVGTALVRFAAEMFRRAGYDHMIVLASLNAAGFYERCGFVEESRGRFNVGDGLPLEYVRMRAPLIAQA